VNNRDTGGSLIQEPPDHIAAARVIKKLPCPPDLERAPAGGGTVCGVCALKSGNYNGLWDYVGTDMEIEGEKSVITTADWTN